MNPNDKAESGKPVRWSAWLGIIFQLLALNKLPMLLSLTPEPVIRRLLITRLQIRKLRLNLGLRSGRLRIVVNRTKVIILQRGYLPLYKGNLTPKFMLWGVACINHPVEVVKVFHYCFHKYWRGPLMPNDQALRSVPTAGAERKKDLGI